MTVLGPILAATDFSAPARYAVDRAVCLAREAASELTLMHVVPGAALQALRQWLGAGHAMEQRLHDDAQRELEALALALQTQQQVTARVVRVSGSVLDEIGREADSLNAAVLVLGARGAGVLRRLVLGSTSERLLRRSTRALLVVRQAPRGPYRRVLVALDFSPWSAHAITLARRVAPHATLLLFHAFQVPFEEKLHFAGVDAAAVARYRQQARAEATQRVHAQAAACGLQPSDWAPLIVEGDASQRILEHEQEEACDLVVLGKHGLSATEDLLLGSVSKHVLAEGRIDVLVSTARAA